MALIHGLKSKFPCPVCLVPKEQLSQYGVYASRHASQSERVVTTARVEGTVAEKEAKLKEYLLHDVNVSLLLQLVLRSVLSPCPCVLCYFNSQNVFWKMLGSNVNGAISWDHLHAHVGLWRDHLWKVFRLIVGEMGRNALATVDDKLHLIIILRVIHY
jgi:hypothetical protein